MKDLETAWKRVVVNIVHPVRMAGSLGDLQYSTVVGSSFEVPQLLVCLKRTQVNFSAPAPMPRLRQIRR